MNTAPFWSGSNAPTRQQDWLNCSGYEHAPRLGDDKTAVTPDDALDGAARLG